MPKLAMRPEPPSASWPRLRKDRLSSRTGEWELSRVVRPRSRPLGRKARPKLAGVGSTRASVGRTVRAVRIVIRDGRVPKPLRWGGALGLLPIPGPFDEFVLVLVASVLWLFYRNQLTEAWKQADSVRSA
jgi:hypothetical protein